MNPSVKKALWISSWVSGFILLVLIFSFFQLPSARIGSALHGQIQSNLDATGIYIIPNTVEFSVWRGFKLHYDRPTIELPDLTRIQIDELDISPSLALLFRGYLGAKLLLKQGAGVLELHAGMRSSANFRATGKFDQIELSRIGLFAWAGGVQGKALFSGDIDLSGDLADPTTLNGKISLKGKGIQLDEQSLFGFPLPETKIQDAVIVMPIEGGKVKFEDVHLGKSLASDDITLQVNGDLTLARNLNSSPLSVQLGLGLSDKLKTKFQFIDTFFPQAKQPDGKYKFVLGGTLFAPMPIR